MPTIAIEDSNIRILEVPENAGWVVLSLVPNAYLILRTDALPHYGDETLQQLGQAIRAIAPEPETTSRYHPTKARALRELRALGIPVSGGEEYGLNPMPVPLEKVRQGLASIKGSLADIIIAERDER